MFGILFLTALTIASVYAIGRTLYERRNPPADYSPATLTFAAAARLTGRAVAAETTALRERLTGEAGTVRIVTARRPDGTTAPEPHRDPEATTAVLNIQHRRAAPGLLDRPPPAG